MLMPLLQHGHYADDMLLMSRFRYYLRHAEMAGVHCLPTLPASSAAMPCRLHTPMPAASA